jgi:hypothetical protein
VPVDVRADTLASGGEFLGQGGQSDVFGRVSGAATLHEAVNSLCGSLH